MRSGGSLPGTRSRPHRGEARGMRVRLRTSAVVVAAIAALATTWALAAAVQPASHGFVEGEFFRYTSVLAMGSAKAKA